MVNDYGAICLTGCSDEQVGNAGAPVLPAPDQFSSDVAGAVRHGVGERKILIKVRPISGDRIESSKVCAL